MLERNSAQENDEQCEDKEIQNGSRISVLRREPSFSRWCDDDGIVHGEHHLENTNASVEDSDFELPLLPSSRLENRSVDREGQKSARFHPGIMNLNGSLTVDNLSNNVDGDGSHMKYMPFDIEADSPRKRHTLNVTQNADANGSQMNYVPFDIENESPGKGHTLEVNTDGSTLRGKDETEPDTESPISLATVLKTLFFILVWYTFSTCLTLYNKTLLGDKLGKFPAPLLMNTVHFAMQAILSKAITCFWSQRFKPTVTMSWRDYYLRVVPTALGTALDINLSNASLVFISVTFATMCKSAAPIFLLLFAFAFKLESPSFKLLGIMLVISVGVLLTVAKETEFEFWGFIFVMLAAVMSGFRWSMTQILLQKDSYGLKDPITLMSYVTPVMAVATAILSLFMDPWDEFRGNAYFNNSWHVLRSCLLMFIGGTLAFFMVLTEYILVSATSAVTVTIAGVVKEAVTIIVAVFYFHDEFTRLKGIGLVIIMVGVSLFNWYKYQKLQKKDQMSGTDASGPSTNNVAGKYVILEEMDDLDDEA